jgi:hypothetical protein
MRHSMVEHSSKLWPLFCFAMLAGCNADSSVNVENQQNLKTTAADAHKPSQQPEQNAENSNLNEAFSSPDDAGDLKYYPLSRYKAFPTDIRPLLQRAEMENDRCRGNSGDKPETLEACNRRYFVLLELEKRGWCWGGSQYSYKEHWLKCSQDRDYRPGQYGAKPPISEDEIQETRRSAAQANHTESLD